MENNKDALKGRIIVAMRNIFVSEYRKIVNKYADQQIWTDIDLSSDAVFSSSTTNSYSMQDVSKALRSIRFEYSCRYCKKSYLFCTASFT